MTFVLKRELIGRGKKKSSSFFLQEGEGLLTGIKGKRFRK
jgi:hypothetical protein